MTEAAISIECMSKLYRIGGARGRHDTLRDAIVAGLRAPMDRLRRRGSSAAGSQPATDTIWALRDITLEVAQGEVLGIIGRNGAGKSTLLKILSRITEPTEGWAAIRGRVASLLEVGTGFHPELTGRENVYLNGAILGMRKAEIDRRFDEIVAFAEIERFLDTPVKRYSSGMYVRLAFSVAAHLEPEVLLVDEVLAVGDAAFQRKCLGRMSDVAREGRTVLFVSHNMAAVQALCNRACWLAGGALAGSGEVDAVIKQYLDGLTMIRSTPIASRTDRQGRGNIRLTDCRLVDDAGREVACAMSGQGLGFVLSYKARSQATLEDLVFAVGIFTAYGQHLIQLSSEMAGTELRGLAPQGQITCWLPRLPLAPGSFSLNLIVRQKGYIEDWIRDARGLDVEGGDFFGTGRLPPPSHGGLLVDQVWSTE